MFAIEQLVLEDERYRDLVRIPLTRQMLFDVGVVVRVPRACYRPIRAYLIVTEPHSILVCLRDISPTP